jgi:hypothetical protein
MFYGHARVLGGCSGTPRGYARRGANHDSCFTQFSDGSDFVTHHIQSQHNNSLLLDEYDWPSFRRLVRSSRQHHADGG